MGRLLQESEVTSALGKLDTWRLDGNAIRRDYSFSDFIQAMEFVNRVAGAAEEVGHHPDITINYNKVTLRLTTHDAGGITTDDMLMAETLDQLPTVSHQEQRRKAG